MTAPDDPLKNESANLHPVANQKDRHSERSEESNAKQCNAGGAVPHASPFADAFDSALDRILSGDMSGLDDIEPELRETVLEMTGLARTAGWLEPEVTPSAGSAVRVDEDRVWHGHSATLPALNGLVPSRTSNRATGQREVTMQAAAVSATPPMSHRTRQHQTQKRNSAGSRNPIHRIAFPGFANAALVVLLLLAGLGGWRVLDGGRIGTGDTPGPSVGHYAQAPGTPIPAATALTSNATVACDFSVETPIYNGVDQPPVDGTVLYVTTSHELMLHCDEEPEVVILAEDVDSATATHWPGVVYLGINADGYEPASVFLNVLTNERIEIGRENSAMRRQGTMDTTGQSPYVISAFTSDASTWALIDLRSMKTRSLSDLGGVEWPRNSDVYIAENGAQGAYAISVFNPSLALEEGPALLQPDGFPGEVMLVSGSLDNVTWIDVPDDLTSPYSVHVSPDGEHIAVMDMPRPQSPGKASIAVLRVSDSAEVTRTDEFNHSQLPDIFWVDDGNALVYVQSGSVMMLHVEEGSVPQALLESDERLFDLKATHDPDVLTVSESGASSREWRGESEHVYAINARTGDMEAFEGRVWQPGSFNLPALRTQSVIVLVDDDEGQNGATTIIDPATGETLLELPFMPIYGSTSERAPSDPLALSINRETAAFTIRDHETLIIVDVSGDGSGAREIPFPDFTPPDENRSVQVDLSPDGTYLMFSIYNEAIHTSWVMDLRDADAIWKQVPEGTWVTFMPTMHSPDQ